jgi:elongation factor G
MPHYQTQDICNLALVGQSGAGKTSLTERLLLQTGVINHLGDLAKGNTVSDFLPLEKEHSHSLATSLVSLDHNTKHINILDTPGKPDFFGHTLSILPAVETIAVVIDAHTGIDMVTRRMLESAASLKWCRMIVINKIDQTDLDLETLIEEIREEFGGECLPINLPANNGTKVVDCFFTPDGHSDFSSVSKTHNQIIDQVVEVDEALMELYLEQGQALSPEQLHDPFEKALRDGHLVPICFVSAQSGAGIQELLDIIERLMPNPLEGNPRPFLKGEGKNAQPFILTAKDDDHVVAHVFKVTADPFLGKLGLFRVHQGTITKESQLFVGDGKKPFRVNHLFKLLGKQQVEISKGIPGDICAVAKVDLLHFDAVLHDSHDEDYLHLKSLPFPEPMYGLAIITKRQGDEQKINSALQRLADEDPCLQIEHHVDLNETVLRGLGELHLRITLERLQREFNIDIDTRPPKIAYRETISKNAEAFHRHKKQSGGAGQFGEVHLRIEPLKRGQGFEFVDEIVGGAIPSQFLPAIEKGVRQVLDSGAIAGYKMQDIRVIVFDGKHHPVDSKEVAFVSAGKKAFLEAIKKANPLVLEPLVNVEIIVPESSMGAITGDLAGKRGRVLGSDGRVSNMVVIRAEIPLAELSDYTTRLKSMTGGQGYFTMELSRYEAVPLPIQQQICAAYKPKDDQD